MYYKMQGYEDRGFTAMRRFAQSLCDSDESMDAGMKVYAQLWPLLFEEGMMTMNYDMLEMYVKMLAKKEQWSEIIKCK